MDRMVKALGYGGTLKVAVQALCTLPSKPPPPNVFADEVWAHDLPKHLKNMTFAITGSSRGMGYELAKRLATRDANLILLNRDGAHTQKAFNEIRTLNKNGTTVQIACDLCDFASVRAAAAEVRKHTTELDCLVCNAGLMAQGDIRTTDGFDIQMQANHLSHFLMTSLLFDLLEKAAASRGEARVVSHSSGARNTPDEPLEIDAFEKAWTTSSEKHATDKKSMQKWRRYQQSKRANVVYTYALQDYIESRSGCLVKATCAHPGATNSGLQSRTAGSTWLDNFINGLAAVAGHSADDGCLGLALATLKEGVSNGDFFGPLELTGNAVLLPSEKEKHGREQLRLLWDKSIAATGAEWP